MNQTKRDFDKEASVWDDNPVRVKLAEFFCEDVNMFKLEECFKVFQNFSEKFKLAVIENEKRRHQEEQANRVGAPPTSRDW